MPIMIFYKALVFYWNPVENAIAGLIMFFQIFFCWRNFTINGYFSPFTMLYFASLSRSVSLGNFNARAV